MNMNANTDSNKLVEDANKLVSDGGSSGASWAALRADIYEYYEVGDVIQDSSELVEVIDRISNELYAKNGLEALANAGVVDRQQSGYRVAKCR